MNGEPSSKGSIFHFMRDVSRCVCVSHARHLRDCLPESRIGSDSQMVIGFTGQAPLWHLRSPFFGPRPWGDESTHALASNEQGRLQGVHQDLVHTSTGKRHKEEDMTLHSPGQKHHGVSNLCTYCGFKPVNSHHQAYQEFCQDSSCT